MVLSSTQETRKLPLPKGAFATVDLVDFDYLSRFSWSLSTQGYPQAHIGRRQVRLHRLVGQRMGISPDVMLDHHNGVRTDARRQNLRPATYQENSRNMRRAWGGVPYKGVTLHKSNKTNPFMARIQKDKGQRIQLGYFATAEEAARAYDEAVLKYHGEFGATNVTIGLLDPLD
jgi:hypothetical protein